jgi:hypothetical protein
VEGNIMSKPITGDEVSSINAPTDKQQFLTPDQVTMIDEALISLGEYGELRLVVERGRLRFVVTHKSFDVAKWSPGTIHRNSRQGR